MSKRIVLVVILFIMAATPVYAHLTGAFKDFLSAVQDPEAAERMRSEIKNTEQEISRLAPRVEQLDREYSEKEEEAVVKLQAYNELQLDMLAYMLSGSEDIVDLLANKSLMDEQMELFLSELDQMFLEYIPLKAAEESLDGHNKLLEVMNVHLEARDELLQDKDLTPDKLADYVIEQWNAHAGGYLRMSMKSDNKLIESSLSEMTIRKNTDSPFRLEESLLNYKSELRYLFRSDHIYVFFEREKANVLLIGSLESEDSFRTKLVFEAGFFNGIKLPEALLRILDGFQIDAQPLMIESKGFYTELTNGAIVLLPMELSGE